MVGGLEDQQDSNSAARKNNKTEGRKETLKTAYKPRDARAHVTYKGRTLSI